METAKASGTSSENTKIVEGAHKVFNETCSVNAAKLKIEVEKSKGVLTAALIGQIKAIEIFKEERSSIGKELAALRNN